MPRTRTPTGEVPKPPIAAVLAELTDVDQADIPTGYGWVRMHCPFHEDRTPSASVNHDPDEGGFACFSCGRTGDGLKLLQSELGLSWGDACDKARTLLGEPVGPARPKRKRRASDLL